MYGSKWRGSTGTNLTFQLSEVIIKRIRIGILLRRGRNFLISGEVRVVFGLSTSVSKIDSFNFKFNLIWEYGVIGSTVVSKTISESLSLSAPAILKNIWVGIQIGEGSGL